MSGFEARLSAIAQASSGADAIAADLSAELASLRRLADDVLCSSWQGAAAAAFDRAWCVWDSGASEVVAALERLAEALAASARAYSVQDLVSSESLRRAVS